MCRLVDLTFYFVFEKYIFLSKDSFFCLVKVKLKNDGYYLEDLRIKSPHRYADVAVTYDCFNCSDSLE